MPLPTPAAAATASMVTQLGPLLLEQPRRGVEHEPAIARGVGPLGRLGVDLGEGGGHVGK